MSEGLKPCPFCGSEAEVSMRDDHCPDEGYYASCTHGNYWNGFHCPVGPITETFDTAEEAVKAWNTRKERTCHMDKSPREYSACGKRVVTLNCPKCSECGESLFAPTVNYCPNCGAKVVIE